MLRHIDVLNRLDPHLGCIICRGPLTDGRCPVCQPDEPATTTICHMCGHLMDEHKPSAHFPGMVACQECIIDSTVCLVKLEDRP
jgi:predicted amidophosphoribosyltransferase